MEIYEKVFKILKERNITQKEFSQMTGIAESTICDWKRKGFNPSAKSISKICDALGITINELFDNNEAETLPDYSIILNDNERELIELFRAGDSSFQKRVLAYMIALEPKEKEVVVQTDADNTDKELTRKKQICNRLRRLARLDRIRLDETEHLSKLNLHLFKYFDFLGIDKLDYIKKYLEHLQPFMITEVGSQEKFANAICVLDEYYRISVYIKVDATKGEELIVSFHENNKNGIAKRNSLKRDNTEVYVFPENITSHVVGTDKYNIFLFITRGATSIPINVSARKYDEDGFLVKLYDITRALVDTANSYLQDLYTADLDYSQIEPFYSLQQLSFTSYGADVFSSISLLIDSLLIQMSLPSKQMADAALCIYCSTIELPESGKIELLEGLKERYKVNSIKALPQLMERIEINLK